MTRTRRPRAWLAALVLGLPGGCAAPPTEPAGSAAVNPPANTAQPTIELLGFPDCPNTPALRASLTAALASIGRGWTFTDTNQEALPEGDRRRGWPAPTILVNGRDLFGLPAPAAASMGCRLYPGGVPDADAIAGRLRARAEAR
ncbi:MAG: hypothetical protein AB7K52_04270 [Phycisphaerales bacterium]